MIKQVFVSAATIFLLTGCGGSGQDAQSLPAANESSSKEISRDDALSIALENADVPSDDIYITEENEDGRTRFEGELFSDGIKYEFEIDGSTGRIFDWNADLRS